MFFSIPVLVELIRSIAGQRRAENLVLGRKRVHHGQMSAGLPNARLARAAWLRRGCQRGL